MFFHFKKDTNPLIHTGAWDYKNRISQLKSICTVPKFQSWPKMAEGNLQQTASIGATIFRTSNPEPGISTSACACDT